MGVQFFQNLPESLRAKWIFVGLVVVLCAIGNLPWHLDNYDQAKQAFVAYEIQNGGDIWFQHTPRGRTASKPPLAGWFSLPVYWASGSWDFAWRLPGFVCFLVLLGILMKEGERLLPGVGSTLAACAFGLNLLTPRIATLVRTDMMLTLWITICGWLILRKIRDGMPWRKGEQWAFFAAMTAALFTKGPILYAFLLPGMIAFALLATKPHRKLVWSGWWTWVLPLGLFLLWGVAGLLSNPEFYEEIVVREFFSRFDQDIRSHETRQPIWFYFPHLLHKFLPWSLLLLVIPALSKNVRTSLRQRPEALWLVCWALGGLLLMTFVPSKRVDRIFPVIPPFCLLFVAMVAACQCGKKIRLWCGMAMVAGGLFAGSYFLGIVWIGYKNQTNELVQFGHQAATLAAQHDQGRLEIVDGRDEGLAMYAGKLFAIHPNRALRFWKDAQIDALIIPERRLKDHELASVLPPPSLSTNIRPSTDRYFLFLRPEATENED